MARKAAPFALRESDIPVLERMKADADHTQAQIANILLTCNEEPQIKKVAERLSVCLGEHRCPLAIDVFARRH